MADSKYATFVDYFPENELFIHEDYDDALARYNWLTECHQTDNTGITCYLTEVIAKEVTE